MTDTTAAASSAEHPASSPAEASATEQLGRRLREVRMARGFSLRKMARQIGVSPSFVSQVERGKANPSVGTLYAFVNELGTSLDELMGDAVENRRGRDPELETTPDRAGDAQMSWNPLTASWPRIAAPVQRSADRRRIQLSGVVWERLTHDEDPHTDFLHVNYAPGSSSCPEHDMVRHGGREYGYVISGQIDIQIGFDTYHLQPGDSIHFDSMTPHRLSNPYSEPCTGIWFVLARREDHRIGATSSANSSHLPGLL